MTILLKLKEDYKKLTGKDPPGAAPSQTKKKDKATKQETKEAGGFLSKKYLVHV